MSDVNNATIAASASNEKVATVAAAPETKPAAKPEVVKETKETKAKAAPAAKPVKAVVEKTGSKAAAPKAEEKKPAAKDVKAEKAEAHGVDDAKKVLWVGHGSEKINPCREGGDRWERYELLRKCDGQTVKTIRKKAESHAGFERVSLDACLTNAEKLGCVKLT